MRVQRGTQQCWGVKKLLFDQVWLEILIPKWAQNNINGGTPICQHIWPWHILPGPPVVTSDIVVSWQTRVLCHSSPRAAPIDQRHGGVRQHGRVTTGYEATHRSRSCPVSTAGTQPEDKIIFKFWTQKGQSLASLFIFHKICKRMKCFCGDCYLVELPQRMYPGLQW